MKNLKKIFPFFIIVSILTTWYTCSPTQPDEIRDFTLLYQVTIPSMNQDSIHISFTMNNWEHDDSIYLIAPPLYADNPFAIATGQNFCNLVITDTVHQPVPYNADSIMVGNYKSLLIKLSNTLCPFKVEYDVKFLYKTNPLHWYMPLPFIGENTGYLQGNYMFLIPCNSKNTEEIWREDFNFEVTYNLGNDVVLYGDPELKATFDTPYQLLFSTNALVSRSVINEQFLFEGTSAGQSFQCINISIDTSFTPQIIDSAKNIFSTILQYITPQFGIIYEAPVTLITGINNKIGLEGMYAFCCKNLYDGNIKSTTPGCMVHEIIHAWIGVRIGEYDDPWWKEGTTSYLAHVITRKLKLSNENETKIDLLDSLAGGGNASNYALSDNIIRSILYTGDGVGRLVYRKGAQVNMLLDRRIRDSTKNKVSLESIIIEFVKQNNNKSFYRGEYIAFLNSRAQNDVSDIFDTYVDTPGPIPGSVLKENLIVLTEYGAFSPEISNFAWSESIQ